MAPLIGNLPSGQIDDNGWLCFDDKDGFYALLQCIIKTKKKKKKFNKSFGENLECLPLLFVLE